MTREEAIKIIDCYDIGYYDLSGEKIPADKLAEAFDMAIEALSAEAVSREEYEEVKEEYINTVGAILAVISAPSCLKEVNDLVESLKVVRCKDCRHANECHKNVQYTRNELNTVTIGYSPIEWCSRGERKEP